MSRRPLPAAGDIGDAAEKAELHALLGNFATYHHVVVHDERGGGDTSHNSGDDDGDCDDEDRRREMAVMEKCDKVSSSFRWSDDLPFDARVFVRRTESRHWTMSWDAEELGRVAVVHTWDLTDAAAEKLNPHLVTAALREESRGEGIVVSNRGGYHSTPDTLHRLAGEGCRPIGFLRDLIEGVAVEVGKPNGGGGGGGGGGGAEKENDDNDKKMKRKRGVIEVGGTKPRHATMTTSWVNVCREGHSHGLHNHVGAQWSGVYYASVPSPPEPGRAAGGAAAGWGGGGGGEELEVAEAEEDEEEEETSSRSSSLSSSSSLSGHLILRLCSGGASPGAPEDVKEGWCAWAAVPPREGRLVLFPSWLLHGVMSVRQKTKKRKRKGGPVDSSSSSSVSSKPRVSIAFNTGERNVVLPGNTAAAMENDTNS